MNYIKARIAQKIDTADRLASSGLTPLEGESVFSRSGAEIACKIGDGDTHITRLPYLSLPLRDNVPIHSIYDTFKTYWRKANAGDLSYKSISGTAGTKWNGMYFKIPNNSDGKTEENENHPKIEGEDYKRKAINCSTLAQLILLGIPYNESLYGVDYKSDNASNYKYTFNPEESNKKYFYNLWSSPYNFSFQDINKDNYNNYFLAERMLSRMAELGTEVSSISSIWQWKPYNTLTSGGKQASDTTNFSWVDYIDVINDLREAEPGDLIFWNNDGETEVDPRKVSHVVTVLDRISYDSSNPNQPLLLLAEATSSSKDGQGGGVQASYYQYDIRNIKEMGAAADVSALPDYVGNTIYKKSTINLKAAPILRYNKVGDNEYTPCYGTETISSGDTTIRVSRPYDGDYLKIGENNNYYKIFQDYYITFNKEEASETTLKKTSFALRDNGGNIYCKIPTDANIYYLYKEQSSADEEFKTKTQSGTNEHKIPKFICRPDYHTVIYEKPAAFRKINANSAEEYIVSDGNNADIITLLIDNVTTESSTSMNKICKLYIKIMGKENGSETYKEITRHYIPNPVPSASYSGIKIPVIINSWVSNSKENDIFKSTNTIKIKICYEYYDKTDSTFKTKESSYSNTILRKVGVTGKGSMSEFSKPRILEEDD